MRSSQYTTRVAVGETIGVEFPTAVEPERQRWYSNYLEPTIHPGCCPEPVSMRRRPVAVIRTRARTPAETDAPRNMEVVSCHVRVVIATRRCVPIPSWLVGAGNVAKPPALLGEVHPRLCARRRQIGNGRGCRRLVDHTVVLTRHDNERTDV